MTLLTLLLALLLAATPRPAAESATAETAVASTSRPSTAAPLSAHAAAPPHYGPWTTGTATFFAWGQWGWPVSARRYPGGGSGCFADGTRYLHDSMATAHRWLPFGTRLQVRYRGRSVVVVVRDRFYGSGLDLTSAACVALLGTKGKCWTVADAQWRVVK